MLETIYNCLEKTTQKTTQKTNMIKLNKNQLKIVDLMCNNPNIIISEMAKILNITVDGVKYNLRKLTQNNIIERIGPDKGGYWNVKNQKI